MLQRTLKKPVSVIACITIKFSINFKLSSLQVFVIVNSLKFYFSVSYLQA